MKRIEVALGARSYPVLIGEGALDRAGELIQAPGRAFLVADSNVAAAGWAARLEAALRPAATIPIAPGEQNKTMAALSGLLDALVEAGARRGDHVVALGGGMTGDLAGLAAALLKRGCAWAQVPTSLLAQVDAAIGGKTAVNGAAGKNMIGAFHQPCAVVIDPATLATLPVRELRAGYAEIVKYGLIGDPSFFAWCEQHGAELLAGDPGARLPAIETCVRAKAAIVAEDERETRGKRALLNFGHTFGHAIEAETGYALLHGEAVATGMALAFRFSAALGLCPAADADRVERHLAAVGLPTRLPPCDPVALVGQMKDDKKADDGQLVLILARGIGEAFVARGVDEAGLAAFLESEAQPG